MKILFTSDLDRTLIFSERTKLATEKYECVEQIEGRNISYISTTSIEHLTKLHAILDFVPVTTRSFEQYQRISFFQKNLLPKTAIVANGGAVIVDGKIDQEWQQHITQKKKALPILFNKMLQQFASIFSAPYVMQRHEVEDLFFVLIIDDKFTATDFEMCQIQLEQFEWTCYRQGRKLYIMPCFLTKGAAVQYIKSKYSYDWHVAAGDSVLDLSMLELADQRFIPQHGELVEHIDERDYPIMKKTSSNFTDACLQQILESCVK